MSHLNKGMRLFVGPTLLLLLGTSLLEAQRTRVLLIGKEADHPYGTHMYMHTLGMLAECLKQQSNVETIVSQGWPSEDGKLDAISTIVLYTSPGAEFLLDGPGAGKLDQMMKQGVGLVTLHWGSAVYEKNLGRLGPTWGNYLGGFWVSNYGLSTDKSWLKQLRPEHPICRGWKEYELHDEFYLRPVMRQAKPLLQVTTKEESVTVGWTHERPGGGRSFGTTLGHFYRNFQIESFRRMVVNGILWTAQMEVPEQGANVDLDPSLLALPPDPESQTLATPQNLIDKSLVAWCIVPFDSQNRSPMERAKMLKRLGLKRVAYDWREQHVATFEDEILAYQKHDIEYFAFWGAHEKAFALFEKYDLHPQIWQMLSEPKANEQRDRVAEAAASVLPIVKRAEQLGCKLGLYNHGGWAGEPENLIAVCKHLRSQHDANHVGIVYNLHHAHPRIAEFKTLLQQMEPYLLCLNLNGMTRDGDQRNQKILPLGEGEYDLQLLKIIQQSDYDGPIGIIGHTQDDVELRLKDNLDGLHWLLPQLKGKPAGPKPKLRTYQPDQSARQTESERDDLFGGVLIQGQPEYGQPPITVECQAKLSTADGYNILMASDTKASGEHWEVFTMPDSGHLTAYLPGYRPDHVRTTVNICDDQRHVLTMFYEAQRVRLFVDGQLAADQAVSRNNLTAVPGKFAVGQIVEGNLRCHGTIDWVHVRSGLQTMHVNQAREEHAEAPGRDASTLLLWQPHQQAIHESRSTHTPHAIVSHESSTRSGNELQAQADSAALREYSPELVERLVQQAQQDGDVGRGLITFADHRLACLSCHQIGGHGGSVGPPLTQLARNATPSQITESVLWPQRTIKPEFVMHQILDARGKTHQGYLERQDDKQIVLRDPTQASGGAEVAIDRDQIDTLEPMGSLMPDNLTGAMTQGELINLLRFLFSLGKETQDGDAISPERVAVHLQHAHAHHQAPAAFAYRENRKPMRPELWDHWQADVNRDRIFDFYGKQAEHYLANFQDTLTRPRVLIEYPGLDGGEIGHWGNQNEETWADDRWQDSDHGSCLAGVFREGRTTIPRAVCVRIPGQKKLSACFNIDTMQFESVWRGNFLQIASSRYGFLSGLRMGGKSVEIGSPPLVSEASRDVPRKYLGYYRVGPAVVFAERRGDQEWLVQAIESADGAWKVLEAPRSKHPLRDQLLNPPPQWPEVIETEITLGTRKPFAIDTIGLPFDNPWKALMFCSGHGFLADGSALVCTIQGDVWRVSDFNYPSRKASWRRFASGLHQPLGMVVDDEGVFVLCRDQIVRLHDHNQDGEADFYECFSRAFTTSPAGHDFICGLQRDDEGFFYIASGNEGIVRVSRDGKQSQVIATGFRNPDGLGWLPEGVLTVPSSEGDWTPASMICEVPTSLDANEPIPHFGYGGPKNGRAPSLPLAYLPRAVDNSSGGQVYVSSQQWGPLHGHLIHLSFGRGRHFLVLRDHVNGQSQGAVVPLDGDFASGIHRGRFHPNDGQLYVCGMQGWGTYTPDDGCFQRVRYVDKHPVQLPIGFHVHQNGIMLEFAEPLERSVAGDASRQFAQCWNYRYSQAYGSPEFSTIHDGVRGHDLLEINSVHVGQDRKHVFLELPELQPVSQLHLRIASDNQQRHDLFVTVHKLDQPFTEFEGYRSTHKPIRPHPIEVDLARATRTVKNPHARRLPDARQIILEVGQNLTYRSPQLNVQPGERIALMLFNPDVVPHNWVLAKPGTLSRVGEMADRSISDPDAVFRHYVPASDDVLAYTSVVLPRDAMTIYFEAPELPGRYPYLCTFPGHWKVMNGVLVVGE